MMKTPQLNNTAWFPAQDNLIFRIYVFVTSSDFWLILTPLAFFRRNSYSVRIYFTCKLYGSVCAIIKEICYTLLIFWPVLSSYFFGPQC